MESENLEKLLWGYHFTVFENEFTRKVKVCVVDHKGNKTKIEIGRSEIEEFCIKKGENVASALLKLVMKKLEEKRNEA